jgi:hypothetical protein
VNKHNSPSVRVADSIESRIFTVRGNRVILDSDLAQIYSVETRVLNQAVRRNREKFPADFMFQLSKSEYAGLRSQSVILEEGRGRHRKYLPYAFTEHGALQAANLLKSRNATAMSVYVIRSFVRLREQIAANAAILKRLAEIDRTLLVHDTSLRDIYEKLLPLLTAPAEEPTRRIGFH